MANYKLNEEKMFADITDGVAIIINSETGIYYGFNELGTIIFEQLTNGANTEDILNALNSIGAPSDIETRLNDFISSMIEKEIVSEAEASSCEVSIDKSIAESSEFELTCEEYNDAQELLLADPIHEVKEESGWTPEKDSIGYSKEETTEREKRAEQ